MANGFRLIYVYILSVIMLAGIVYGSCTREWEYRTDTLSLECDFDRRMLDSEDMLPEISGLVLRGVGCSGEWDVLPWVVSHLRSPALLKSLSLSSCHGIHVGEEDLAALANLRQLSIRDGRIASLHPRALSGLRHLQSVSLVRVGLPSFPSAVTGQFPGADAANRPWLPSLRHLDFWENQIPDIPVDAFVKLANLTYLKMAKNRLQRLEAGPLQYLEQLETLDISLNLITSLPSGGFVGLLPRLRALIMEGINLLNLTAGGFAGLTNLRKLDISIAPIATLHPQAFQGLASLEEINIQYNPLRSVPQGLLMPVRRTLRKIDLSECQLTSIPEGFFKDLPLLEEVDISKNAISSLGNISFPESSKLRKVDLAENSIAELPANFFQHNPEIETILLERNAIAHLQKSSFSNLRNLRVVNLSQNNLTALTLQAFFNLSSLQVLDLSGNLLRRFPSDALLKVPALQELRLASNRLTNFFWLPFVNHDAMNPTNELAKPVTVDILGNPLRCDCDMFSLVGDDHEYIDIFWPGANLLANQRFKNYEQLQCWWPPPLIHMPLYIETEENHWNDFLFFSTSQVFCPDACQCYIRCEDSLNITLCSGANFTSIPHNLSSDINVINLSNNELSTVQAKSLLHMKYLYEIDLSSNKLHNIEDLFSEPFLNLNHVSLGQNKISFLSEQTFKGVPNLAYLDLSQNSISYIDPQAFSCLSNLQALHLDHNALTSLELKVLNTTTNLTELTLNNNPFICNCDLIWLKSWLQTRAEIVSDTESINCTTKLNITGEIVYLDDEAFMCSNKTEGVSVDMTQVRKWETVAVCLGVVVLLAGALAVAYKFRKVIQVVVYNSTGLRFLNKADRDGTKTYLYDAFISFSSEDLAFVTRELVPRLESQRPPFRLCIHQRDFVVGECIAVNIINAIETSRRTLLVLSNNYMQSEWCSFEFQAAHDQLLKDHQTRLIVLLLEDVDRSLLNEDLRLYLSTNTYLDRRDPLFWEKLNFSMPDKRKAAIDHREAEPSTEDSDIERDNPDELELQDDLRPIIS